MDGNNNNKTSREDDMELRRGPWTVEEDLALINYIATHGEGRWNSLARSAGLKRTGKSCRFRWLNYLRPDVRRGNITLEEQLLIIELHSCWGNRQSLDLWSKIAQYLPGRTDNEIKNCWRTRVQKHAKQLKCDVNSKQFKDTMRYLWMPRLVERIQAAAATAPTTSGPTTTTASAVVFSDLDQSNNFTHTSLNSNFTPETSAISSDDYYSRQASSQDVNLDYHVNFQGENCGYVFNNQGVDYQGGADNIEKNTQQQWYAEDTTDNLWNVEDIYVLQQQLNNSL
ncbi:hypothetical protein Cgig2_007969 [Carnegiea gigantea]|uniref:Uncharacterized protein n=1 Tax=Carnegiea gigantea TaxID=171969 RepID=A0A9Q1GLJ9_9CARY|nr:hypothetical protein Cgig2_007969 [Carnegiea gigantea]